MQKIVNQHLSLQIVKKKSWLNGIILFSVKKETKKRGYFLLKRNLKNLSITKHLTFNALKFPIESLFFKSLDLLHKITIFFDKHKALCSISYIKMMNLNFFFNKILQIFFFELTYFKFFYFYKVLKNTLFDETSEQDCIFS